MTNISVRKLLKIYENNENIGIGNFGVVNKFDENTLIKLYNAKPFVPRLLVQCLKERDFDLIQKETNKKDLERLKKLIERQSSIKYTKLPIDTVITKKYLSAVLLPYYKGYITLFDLNKSLNLKEKVKILEIIREKVLELEKNYIYPTDLHQRNVIINLNTYDTVLIDLDDKFTIVTDDLDTELKRDVEWMFELLESRLKKGIPL